MCPGGPAEAWAPASLPLLIPSPAVRLPPAGRGCSLKHSLPGTGSSALPASEMSHLPLSVCCLRPATSRNLNLCRGLPGCQETCHLSSRTSLCRLLHCPCCSSAGFGTCSFFKLMKTTCFSLFLTAHDSGRRPCCCTPVWVRENGIYLKELPDISKMPSSSIFHARK